MISWVLSIINSTRVWHMTWQIISLNTCFNLPLYPFRDVLKLFCPYSLQTLLSDVSVAPEKWLFRMYFINKRYYYILDFSILYFNIFWSSSHLMKCAPPRSAPPPLPAHPVPTHVVRTTTPTNEACVCVSLCLYMCLCVFVYMFLCVGSFQLCLHLWDLSLAKRMFIWSWLL